MTLGQTRNVVLLLVIISMVAFAALSIDSIKKVTAERTPEVTAQVEAGKAVWQAKNCNDCHTILGIGGYYAPELTKVMDRRDATWLASFLLDPQKAKPGTTMPNMGLTEKDAADLIAFFQWVGRIDTNDWPPKPIVSAGSSTGSQAPSAGQALMQQKGCVGCHTINGQGAAGPGPNLTGIGAKYDRQRIEQILTNPKDVNPAATMPIIPLTRAEQDSIADYLLNSK